MKMFQNIRCLFLPIIILMGQCTLAVAQKLPKVQQASIRAPQNIKIDGKITEWNDRFQAHNLGNHMFYTISNDDNNLYLTVRMDDTDGSKKILKGGLTFTALPLAKTANKVSFTFPAITKRLELEGRNPLFVYGELKGDTVKNKARIDSLIATSSSYISKNYKEIYVTGIPEIGDPFLSVYNTEGIMVGASYDRKMRYIYELAIPLKYLNGVISDVKSIRYDIKLNVLPIRTAAKSSVGQKMDVVNFVGPSHPPSISDMFNCEDSDFSGVYILALKE